MRTRRLGVTTILTLTAGLLVGVPVAASPAAAAEPCLTEPPPGLLSAACDDTVPPDTALTAVSTPPNAAGWVATSTMSFAFTGAHTDADADPIAFECKLDAPTQAHGWVACTSPRTYDGLADSDAAAYTFSVRAVDAADNAYSPPFVAEVVADVDASPATLTWGQDTVAPVAFVNPDLYDEQTPQQPVVLARTVPVRLNSNEVGATFECEVDGETTPCTAGAWSYTDAPSGRHFLRARSVDKAGNPSAWSQVSEFFVPTDLRGRRGWKRVTRSNAFDATLTRSKRKGARIVLPRQRVGELRLYAPTAPSYGKVRVRVGATNWRVVDLSGRRSARKELVVIGRDEGSRTGKIVIEVLTRNKPVLLDAIVARTNVFQG